MTSCVGYLLLVLAVVVYTESYHYHGFRHNAKIVKRQTTPCDSGELYRRADGRCNNLANPEWGSAGTVMPRILPNAYANGVNSPRADGRAGTALPGPRTVSLNTHGPSSLLSKVTLMVMQWGQFVDHDTSITPHPSVDPDCCTNEESVCLNIPIPADDEYFTGRSCMPFVRSTRTEVEGVEEQSNALTSFIDASNVYGSSEEHMQDLRGDNGLLRDTNLGPGKDFLPEAGDAACRNETDEFCFEAGDERVNEQPGLAAMHTIFLREHNRIARELRRRNDNWDSDRIFQETRRIVGAIMQHITYHEFLPLVLGPVFMRNYGLRTDQTFTYSETVNPGITNEFATAAYRFGHSLVPEDIHVNKEALEFKNMFFRPTTVLNSMDGLCSALGKDQALAMDRQFAHSVTRHLFQVEERTGFDLVSLNIQRGRDHGLQPLNEYRKICTGTTYTELSQLFPSDSTAQSTYQHVDDVDLFTGGVAERAVDDGLVGPTFACLLGTQFNFLRNGDRFFYLNREGPQRFTREQLDEIRKIRLSKIICENSENKEIQGNVFLPQSDSNRRRDCSRLPGINLDRWGGGGGGGGGGGDGPRRPGDGRG